jgi:serine/threonine protein kinase
VADTLHSGLTPVGPDEQPTLPFADHDGPPFPPDELPEYDLVRELGRGGAGVVYLARNRLLGRLEALKVVTRPADAGRLLREARAVARAAHPNVVAAYAAREAGGRVVLAMEYVDGVDLFRLVVRRGPLPAAAACGYVRQAALGLHHAHALGLTHRDVKPHNLILAADGTAKVLDFGLAEAVGGPTGGISGNGPPPLVGTPGYLAPERVADPAGSDPRSDVYSLGCTLYYLLTGRPPFAGDDPHAVARRQQTESPEPVESIRPDVPPAVARVVARMIARRPADRYPSAAAAADALAAVGRPPRAAWWAAAASLGLAAAVVAWLATRDTPPSPPPPEPPPRVELYNGRDLAGWVVDGDPAEWRSEDGAIGTFGARNGPKTWLLTEADYGDVRFGFEYRLDRGGNSGVAFRAVPGEQPVLTQDRPPHPTPYHLQVELSDDADRVWGKYPTGQVNGWTSSDGPCLKPVRPAPLKPPGEWNRAEFELRGQHLRFTANGVVIQDADLEALVKAGSLYPGLRRRAGRLGFQQQARGAQFRGVWVQPLPAAGG